MNTRDDLIGRRFRSGGELVTVTSGDESTDRWEVTNNTGSSWLMTGEQLRMALDRSEEPRDRFASPRPIPIDVDEAREIDRLEVENQMTRVILWGAVAIVAALVLLALFAIARAII